MTGQFYLHLWFTVSVCVLPVIAILVMSGLNRFERRFINGIEYMKDFAWILLGYLVGAAARIILLGRMIKTWDMHPMSPNIAGAI